MSRYKKRSTPNNKNHKLGVVKFQAHDDSHGYVIPISFFDEVKNRSFLSQNGALYRRDFNSKGDLIRFNLKESGKKKTATNISSLVTVYTILKGSRKSVRILEGDYWKEIVLLSTDLPLGFSKARFSKCRLNKIRRIFRYFLNVDVKI